MTIKYYPDMIQGSEEWLEVRRGILTASEMKLIITPAKLEYASNEKERTHLYDLAGQRISGYVEPGYMGDAMLRGKEDEILARAAYNDHYHPVIECGFVTNDKYGFTLGYSPDGLVGDDGQIEAKSRMHKFQVETIISDKMPDDFKIQVQTGLLISERAWCDFISYSAGLPMKMIRIPADTEVQGKILLAATTFHQRLGDAMKKYQEMLEDPKNRLIPTKRREPLKMMTGETT